MVEAVNSLFRWLLWLALALSPATLPAHQLDEYLQATLVDIEPGQIRFSINLTPGVAVANRVLALVDADRDGLISTNELAAYAHLFKQDLVVRLDERPCELKASSCNNSGIPELRTGFGLIQIELLLTPGSLPRGAHRLTMENRHLPTNSAYLFNAAKPVSSSIQITAQHRNENQSTGAIEFTLLTPPRSTPSLPVLILATCAILLLLIILIPRHPSRLSPPPL